ncbi:TMV resistance protein N-like [Pistacia vera]|uniref:TMV resistance protein N-like n=1 Tax=Pistacia vera TaxID=55513 RepID=UPI001263ABB8|nr:TMV resistance protein N-like [Pistacia vera]
MASSSSSLSSNTLQAKYDVFLSFRGEDTRDNFTSLLYAVLCRKQIQTFIDYDGLKRGDEISPILLKAIEESRISVIIFSKNYASSKWCLDKLVKILECKEKYGQMVMPIFYHVTPSDVRKQSGTFKDAFVKQEKKFKKIPKKVRRWRTALTMASNLSRWDSMVIRPESKLVGDIVKEILKKLNDLSPSRDCEGLIGMDAHIDHIESILCLGLSDFRMVRIWGMGGIGKTTLAEALFNRIYDQFEHSCFIPNVREESERYGQVYLRNQVLSQMLEEENLTIGTPNVPRYIKKRLENETVFIVLDDVHDLEQLEFFIAGIDGFGPGSRVIVTTRDKRVLSSYGVDNIYELNGFKYHEALQIFSNFAFKQRCSPKEFLELSDQFVD